MSQSWNIAVLGACGMVGEALIDLLAERRFPLAALYLLDAEENAGEQQRVAGKTYYVQSAGEFDWQQAHIAFFVASTEASAHYVRAATDAGCVVIDGSGLFSSLDDVPLVAPQLNDALLAEYRHRNIVALAGSLTCQLLLALKPLIAVATLAEIQVTSLLAASAHGQSAVQVLAGQSAALLNGQSVADYAPFTGQLAFNTLPFLPDEAGSVAEDRRLVNEVRKILRLADLPVSASCVQVPVFYGHGQLVNVALQPAISPEQGRKLWADCDDIRLSAETDCPDPVRQANQSGQLAIGCVRENYGKPGELQFWSVADNVRFSGAFMAVQAAEKLVAEYWC